MFYHWPFHHVALSRRSSLDLRLPLCDMERAQRALRGSDTVWVIPPDGETLSSLEKGQRQKRRVTRRGRGRTVESGSKECGERPVGGSGVGWRPGVPAGGQAPRARQSWFSQQQTGSLTGFLRDGAIELLGIAEPTLWSTSRTQSRRFLWAAWGLKLSMPPTPGVCGVGAEPPARWSGLETGLAIQMARLGEGDRERGFCGSSSEVKWKGHWLES